MLSRLVLLAGLIAGCATAPGYASFWNECVKANAWGFTMGTPYGPINVGYLTWERNVDCKKDIEPTKPTLPTTTAITSETFRTKANITQEPTP